ncbi:MAG TPA: hypothetical protein VN963_00050, partial [bacterium]|nr:hypothetical protein [bacterium]
LEETAAHLQQALAAERAKTDSLALENTVLYETNASNQQIAKGLNAEKKCLKQQLEEFTVANEADNQVSDQLLEQQLKIAGENRRLIANLEEENRRYLVLDAESKTALEAKQCAEESATFAIKNLDLVQTELNQSIQGRQAAESALALRSAQLQRNIEDLKYLNADILELADLAEKNQGERNEFYTESQYGYLRQKCDDLQHRRNALLERMHAAEKAAKQAGLEVGYRESAHQAEVMGLKKEIIDLKDQITGLQQDCTVLRKADFAAENAILREKLKKAHAANKVSEVLKGLENSAVAGSLRLEKEKQELQTKVLGLESKLAEQSQSPRPLRPLNRLVVAMGFLSVGLAVAGCVTSASVFGLPLSPFLFIAAAVTCMVGFVASALDRKPLVPKEALAVKAALQRSPEASSFIMST